MVLTINLMQQIAFVGIIGTGLFLLVGFLTRMTNGLFFSRFPSQFIKDRTDPRFEKERSAGKRFSYLVFKYVPPFFIGFVLILLLSYLLDQ